MAAGIFREGLEPRPPARTPNVRIAIPLIEAADHVDTFGIRRPHGETPARHACNTMRAELVVNPLVIARADQIQIEVADRRLGQFCGAFKLPASPPKSGPHIRGCYGRWRNSPCSSN